VSRIGVALRRLFDRGPPAGLIGRPTTDPACESAAVSVDLKIVEPPDFASPLDNGAGQGARVGGGVERR